MTKVSSNVGTKKLFENDKIILWVFELEPGEETPLHRHERSYVWYALEGIYQRPWSASGPSARRSWSCTRASRS